MSLWQHYYTSYVNKQTGNAGFQVKAMSPGLSPEMQSTIMRLISYRIPPTLDVLAIASHPIALRYYYKGPHECILLYSQSTGNDESGRPGNFFAHTLVLEPELFSSVPGIFYWKSPFWHSQDKEIRTRVDSLPVLPAFDEEPSLDLEQIWIFLDQGERRALLYKLLCAVVHSSKTQRRIVILDAIEHVVYWIAAISCLLPPIYRPLLTFATYHHNPHQGHYLITGTTRDSVFHASAEDHQSYFILDAYTGVTSAVPVSPYAELATACAYTDLYEARLLSLFVRAEAVSPAPTKIDEQLDLMTLQ